MAANELAKMIEARESLKEKLRQLEARIELESIGILHDMETAGLDEMQTEAGTLVRKTTRSINRKKDVDVVDYVESIFPEIIKKDFNTRTLTSKVKNGLPERFEDFFDVEDITKIVLK